MGMSADYIEAVNITGYLSGGPSAFLLAISVCAHLYGGFSGNLPHF